MDQQISGILEGTRWRANEISKNLASRALFEMSIDLPIRRRPGVLDCSGRPAYDGNLPGRVIGKLDNS
jgi:hypothetical protein